MPITQILNSKANVKKFTNNDLPFAPQQPVIASFRATSTAGQTVINLTYSIDQSITDIFWLFVDGKKLELGSSNDYTFTSIAADNTSSQVTLRVPLVVGLNIEAFKLGLKKESEFQTDNRFVAAYDALDQGFQGFVNQTSFVNTATSTTGSPAAGKFYSTISNRASMVDLSQDLKPRMGVERMMTQQIYEIPTEFGPAGERVWGTTNDLFGQIRLIGYGWTNENNAQGQDAFTANIGDFMEITFYGTGLNWLMLVNGGGNDVRASVDGGSEGANIFPPGTASGILNSRNVSNNSVLPVVSGLALGVHTVKIRWAATAGNIRAYGFEILNESSLVKVPSGIAYIKGQKYTSSALQSFSYSAPVTGVRGGRVVAYQNADGTIGQAFQATNAASAFTTSADHTNEEVARVYNFREFGANRSDDFSTLVASSKDAVFILDDDTTTLLGNQVFQNTSFQGFYLAGTSNFYTFTFVGTGLDVVLGINSSAVGTQTVDSHSFIIDGATVGTITSVNSTGLTKIASGLPYGTHTFKVLRNVNSANSLETYKFIVYQPKKPTVPAAAIELADYNVMADYVANSVAGLETIGTGALRKSGSRELVYVEGTGGTQSWNISLDTVAVGGITLQTDRVNAQAIYTFFGTGFELRYRVNTNRSSNISVTVDGVALTTGNFPSLVTSVYGGGSFSAGTLSQNGTLTQGGGFTAKGLTLGLHTVKFNNNTASSFLDVHTIDVVTPIHSNKSNFNADFQNTLPVGSNAISDNRKLTPVKDALPSGKAWAQAVGVASSPTTTSSVFIPVPDLSVTIKLNTSGRIKITGLLTVSASGADTVSTQLYVDGLPVGSQIDLGLPSSGFRGINSQEIIVPVSAGAHKVDMFWKSGGSTDTAGGTFRVLTVEEL